MMPAVRRYVPSKLMIFDSPTPTVAVDEVLPKPTSSHVESGDLDRVGAGPKACKRILAVAVGGSLCFGHARNPDRNAPETRVLDRYRASFG